MDFFWIFITEQSVIAVAKAKRLRGKAAFSEEIALIQNADCGFLADLRYDSEPYLSFFI